MNYLYRLRFRFRLDLDLDLDYNRHSSDIIGEDVINYVKEFEISEKIPRGCNSSCIALLPKVEDPLFMSDYRPLSLIGCQFRIIAKILVNRLSKVISSIVSEVQTTYIKDRQIDK